VKSGGVDILLVEDDRRLAELTAQYFRQNGLDVVLETRGDRASPQLVIHGIASSAR